MTMTETTKEAVYRMFVLEGKRREDIEAEFGDRLTKKSIEVYIAHAISKAKKNNIDLSHRKGERKKTGMRPGSERKQISRLHFHIGNKITRFRYVNDDMNINEFCQTYKFANPIRLVLMELGQYDFCLSDLQRLSEILDLTITQLMEIPYISANPITGPVPGNQPIHRSART
jgi:hypothetical protein